MDLKGYRYSNNVCYVSKRIPYKGKETPFFLEYLVEGSLKLYFLKSPDKTYYVEKDNGQIIPLFQVQKDTTIRNVKYSITEKYFIDSLLKLLDDCPEIKPKIKSTVLKHKSLINLSKEYHKYTCGPDEECIVYQKTGSRKFDWGFYFGYNRTSYLIRSSMYQYKYQINDFAQSIYPNIGVIFTFKPLYWKDKFSVSLCSDFSKQEFTADSVGTKENERSDYIKLLGWNNAVLFNVSPNIGKNIKPYFFIGADLCFQKRQEQDLFQYTIGGIDADEIRNSPISSLLYGGEGGLGLDLYKSKKATFFCLISYSYTFSTYAQKSNIAFKGGVKF